MIKFYRTKLAYVWTSYYIRKIWQRIKWGSTDEPIHEYFELSYASYLVLPRSILQSMPKKWQRKTVTLLRELESECRVQGIEWPVGGESIAVNLRGRDGKFKRDFYCSYRRGHRNVFSEMNEIDRGRSQW